MIDTTDAERIHQASLNLLRDPGIRLEQEGIVEALLRAGAMAAPDPSTVRIPVEMVRDALESAPSDVVLAGRGGSETMLTACPSSSCIWSTPGMNLARHGRVSPFTSADMVAYTRLLDRLSCVDGVFGLALADAPAEVADVLGLVLMAAHTAKHIRVLCASPEGADAMTRMQSVLGDTPWFSIGFTAHGPLRWTRLALEIFARTAGHGIPTTINGEPMAGASGPVTLAGAAVVGNAEILAGLVVNQVLEAGRPCIYNLGLAHTMDMKTGEAVTGGPENHLLAEVSAAMGRFYDLPSCSWVSTDAMLCDAQAAVEKSLGWKTHLEAGVSLVWGVGQLESELTVSPAMAVMDDEIIAYVKRLRRGVEVTDDTLADAVIRDVGVAGSFLAHEHTLKHFRDELFAPMLLWRGKRHAWEAGGEEDVARRAEALADEWMEAPGEPILSPDDVAALRAAAAPLLDAGDTWPAALF